MKTKSSLILLLVFLSAGLACAEEITASPRLAAVLPFQASGISADEADVFTDRLAAGIHKTGIYRVLDKSEQDTILKELEFSLSGCVDESCQLEVGKILSANLIITGSIGPFGKQYVVNVKIIRVETGETVHTASEYYNDMQGILKNSEKLVRKLLDLPDPVAMRRAANERRKQQKPKIGYFSLAVGYSELFRSTDDGAAACGLPELGSGDTYGSSNSADGPLVDEYDWFGVEEFLQGLHITVGYEYPLVPELSLGGWVSYLFGDQYNDYYSDTDIDEDYVNFYEDEGGVQTARPPDLIGFSAGISVSARVPGSSMAAKLDLGYNFSNIIMVKAGFAWKGFFIKGMLGYPLGELWETSYDYGGIFSVEGGIELKI
ncbi:MAG: hypothetical protein JW874_08225 [Spirochaetales bacterium]|nr:hypothetical protein [Spirochaetales bacterium]